MDPKSIEPIVGKLYSTVKEAKAEPGAVFRFEYRSKWHKVSNVFFRLPNEHTAEELAAVIVAIQALPDAKRCGLSNWCIHEVVTNQPLRLFFDLDLYDAKDDIEQIISSLLTTLNMFLAHTNRQTSRDEWKLFCSVGKDYAGREKRGYHLISQVWKISSPLHGRALLQELRQKLPENVWQHVDYTVYKRAFMVRVAGCSKVDEARYLSTSGNEITDGRKLSEELGWSLLCLCQTAKETIHIQVPQQYENEITLSDDQLNEAKEIVLEKMTDFTFYRELSGIICLARKQRGECDICHREHEHENAYVYVTPDYRIWFCCRRTVEGRLHLGNLSSLPSHLRDMVFPEDKEYDPDEIGIETGKSEIAFDAIPCGDERPEQGASTTIAVVPKDLPSDLAKLLLFPGDELDDEFSA